MTQAPSIWLALRSLRTVLFPGVFAGYLPWRLFGLDRVRINRADPIHLAGVLFIAFCEAHGTLGT